MTDFIAYRLPDNRIVNVDASAAKGALLITYTLAGGEIVEAMRVLTHDAECECDTCQMERAADTAMEPRR